MEKLASITILTKNRQQNSPELNKILTEGGHLIMSRMGVNVQKTCTEHCPGMIILALKAKSEDIIGLFEKINRIDEVSAEMSMFEDN